MIHVGAFFTVVLVKIVASTSMLKNAFDFQGSALIRTKMISFSRILPYLRLLRLTPKEQLQPNVCIRTKKSIIAAGRWQA